jgi:hypothetical protein
MLLKRHSPGPAVEWFLGEISRLAPLAHHPTCPCYSHHVLRIRGRYLCLGCACLLGGITAGLCTLGLRLAGWAGGHGGSGVTGDIAVGLGLFLPTLVQPFVQAKLFKAASRFALGVGIVWLWQAAVLKLPLSAAGFLLRAVFVVVFCAVFRWAQRFRKRFTPAPSDSCPAGRYPFCAGNRVRVAALLPTLRGRATGDDALFVAFVESWLVDQGEVAG